MSDSILKLIPEERGFVPEVSTHQQAIKRLGEFFTDHEEVSVCIHPHLEFVDQGENLEAIICPSCATRLELNYFVDDDPVRIWWDQVNLDADVHHGEDVFELNPDAICRMPCCQDVVKFIDLQFDWPGGFAEFELQIDNPQVENPIVNPQEDTLSPEQLRELENLLGCRLRVIWARY
jgi:hypothetical protein